MVTAAPVAASSTPSRGLRMTSLRSGPVWLRSSLPRSSKTRNAADPVVMLATKFPGRQAVPTGPFRPWRMVRSGDCGPRTATGSWADGDRGSLMDERAALIEVGGRNTTSSERHANSRAPGEVAPRAGAARRRSLHHWSGGEGDGWPGEKCGSSHWAEDPEADPYLAARRGFGSRGRAGGRRRGGSRGGPRERTASVTP